MLLVDVCINLPVKQLNKTYTYELPSAFDSVDIGWRVVVPFAGNLVEGFVLKKFVGEYSGSQLKSVCDVIDSEAWFDEKMLETAKWIADYYLCTLAEAMRLFLPGKKSITTTKFYKLQENVEIDSTTDVTEQKIINVLLDKETISLVQLKKVFGANSEKIIASMLRKELIVTTRLAASKFKKQIIKYVSLACDANVYLQENPKCPKGRKKALELLVVEQQMPMSLLIEKGVARDTINRMQKLSLLEITEKHVARDSYKDFVVKEKIVQLNSEQEYAVKEVAKSIDEGVAQTFLLLGITGSGKTQVYLETADLVYKKGKQVLVLVPEIALTGQIVERFKSRFLDDVFVVHSRLSVNERMDVFEYIKTGEPCILIGVRSAIFAPFSNLGLIVIDEEHEFSYKQEERPGYHTRQVAQKIAELNNAPLLLGSATPSLESFRRARASEGEYRLLRLENRVQQAQLPDVVIVDMKKELQEGNRGVLSKALLAGLQDIMDRKEQAIILLNRRGFATFVMCRDCSYVAKCKHCAVSLVYHQTDTFLHCHYCGYTESAPEECPSCKSRRIKFFGTGTQKAQQQLEEGFADLRVIRMDQDTTGGKLGHEKILSAFRNGDYDLLLGTQMVAKGHDVPNVTLVGILAADAIINLPDFRASERTFALLTQAAGRAGRGDKKGVVVLQTYETEHPVIDFAIRQDYEGFAVFELQERKELLYPPFSSMLKITVVGVNEEDTLLKAKKVVSVLRAKFANVEDIIISDPFPGIVARIKEQYKMIIIVKAVEIDRVKELLVDNKFTEDSQILIDIDPLSVI